MRVELKPGCWFEKLPYCSEPSLEYIEHQADPWYSDDQTSVDIDKEKAQEIVDFLYECYGVVPVNHTNG